MNKYELAVVVSAKIEDDERAQLNVSVDRSLTLMNGVRRD